jgi:hypothetical protein
VSKTSQDSKPTPKVSHCPSLFTQINPAQSNPIQFKSIQLRSSLEEKQQRQANEKVGRGPRRKVEEGGSCVIESDPAP